MRFARLAVLVFATTACAPLPFSQLEPGMHVEVETTSGARIDAVVVQQDADVMFEDERGQRIEPHRIARVIDVQRTRGALLGLLVGGAAGAAIGAAVGYVDYDEDAPCSGCLVSSRAENVSFTATLVGVLGAAMGLVSGAFVGSDDVYVPDDTRNVRITPRAPRGSVAGVTVQF
jgi:hypothetical protein